MAISTALSGMFLFLFTTSTSPDTQLAFSSLEALFQNAMYGTMFAVSYLVFSWTISASPLCFMLTISKYTPEVFPAPNRGTGSGISSFLNRVAGLCAPIVAVYGGEASPLVPIYASGGLFFAAFLAMIVLPIETMGRQTL